MTGPPAPTDAERDRATAELGIPVGGDAIAARAAFLRRLPDANFLPAEAVVAAVNALGGTRLALTATGAREAATAWPQDVDAFARGYFALAPAERRLAWQSLSERCPVGPSAAFLKHLGGALDVATREQPDGETAELADLFRELFVLRTRARAIRRATWCVGRGTEATWRAALANLRRLDPATAALDPIFAERIAKPVVPAAEQDVAEAELPRRVSTAPPRSRVADEPYREPASWSWSPSTWGRQSWLFIVFVCVLARGLILVVSNSSSAPRTTYSAPEPPKPVSAFNAEQERKYRAYDPKSGKPAPPGYAYWAALQKRNADKLKPPTTP